MKLSKQIILFFAVLILFSCKHKKTKDIERNNIFSNPENLIDKTVQNVIDISKDTIIAFKYKNELILTTDGGVNWTTLENTFYLNEFTLTDKNILIGIHSWQGIHEADFCRLYFSKDLGKIWDTITFDTNKFFPIKITSNPKEQLCVQTANYKIYKLTGENLNKDWTLIKTLKEPEPKYDVEDYPYKIDDAVDIRNKLYKINGMADTLAILTLCRQVNDLINTKDIIYISGMGYEPNTDINYGYYAHYTKKNGLKEYKFEGRNCYLKMTQLGNVYIMSNDGLFIENNDSIKRLY
jgi:hypothetical protein